MSPGKVPDPDAPSAALLLRLWTEIGLKSFGGGASTQLLIRRTFVEERHWIDDAELGHLWSLCQFTPGINLVSLTVLIGRKLGGTRGIIVSLLGMLLPSAAVTCLLTAGFEALRHGSAIHAVLRGVVPATAGIMALVAVGFARPVLAPAWKEGIPALSVSLALILGTALAVIELKLSVIVVVAVVALLGAAFFTSHRLPAPARPADDTLDS